MPGTSKAVSTLRQMNTAKEMNTLKVARRVARRKGTLN